MHSWVRYSVSAYLGLLLAGSIASPGIAPPASGPMASIRQRPDPPAPNETYYLVPATPDEVQQALTES